MYLYNITYNIEESIHEKWLRWVQKNHIPEVLQKTPFTSARLIQVLMDEEMGGITYSIQYQATTRKDLDNFLNNDQYDITAEMQKLFSGLFVSFSTELKVINDFN